MGIVISSEIMISLSQWKESANIQSVSANMPYVVIESLVSSKYLWNVHFSHHCKLLKRVKGDTISDQLWKSTAVIPVSIYK